MTDAPCDVWRGEHRFAHVRCTAKGTTLLGRGLHASLDEEPVLRFAADGRLFELPAVLAGASREEAAARFAEITGALGPLLPDDPVAAELPPCRVELTYYTFLPDRRFCRGMPTGPRATVDLLGKRNEWHVNVSISSPPPGP